ncbi:MAG TPA: Stp1/IreP family PP2C-type Ser/Thr phosphatase, partial [Acidimicrobiales bacterium]
MTTFRAGSATDVGRVRSNNQDSLLVREGELFAVADGMGGHQGGEVASALALETLGKAHDDPSTSTLVQAVRSANQAVFEKAGTSPDLKGMGTTLTALADVDTSEGKRLGIVNVGDSRLYRARGDHLEQLTEDHSLVASLVRQGRITAEEAESHPQRNILTRALGIDEAVAVDSWEVEPVPGDRFLICSDGLFNEVDEGRMIATLRRFDDPADAARELVRLANEGGG